MPFPLPLRVAAWRVRRLALPLTVLAAAVVVGGAIRASAPPPPGQAVVVAAADLPAGRELGPRDLTVAHLPPDAVPEGAAADPAAWVGTVLQVAVPAALPIVPEVLAGDRFAVDPPPGTVVVAVDPGDGPTAALLTPGDHVDLVTEAAVVARAALVLDVTEPADGGLLTSAGAAGIVVAVSPAQGRELAATPRGAIGVVLVP